VAADAVAAGLSDPRCARCCRRPTRSTFEGKRDSPISCWRLTTGLAARHAVEHSHGELYLTRTATARSNGATRRKGGEPDAATAAVHGDLSMAYLKARGASRLDGPLFHLARPRAARYTPGIALSGSAIWYLESGYR